MKPKSKCIVFSFRLDERCGKELKAQAEKLNTPVFRLVEQYVMAGLRESDFQEKIAGIPQKTEKVCLN